MEENDQERIDQHIGFDGWRCNQVQRRHIALVTWRVVRRNDHVNTAENDDGLDGTDEMDYVLAKGALQPWMVLEYSSQDMQQLFSNHG
ncbi:predicted protein [Lichtheimia corymbifera JMRC:FSU:9682]|uniref:Uncharacterized protein n=1 Tax=Lichtheimia corymbifera JMRC:FSU:9682 TaxID=1263082 RepID=A0A068S7K3_9FUNG|nr:predicted protein [Lichtheimia corymbifera JMRC:FSU:9682]